MAFLVFCMKGDVVKLTPVKYRILFSILSLLFFAASLQADQPNIIWIVADDLGYNDLSCMGQKHFKTPRLDQMAAEGMRFTQFYAGSTVCAPSRACFLTGQHTGHIYQRFNGKVQFRDDPLDITIATLLKKAGYKTALIGKSGLACNSNDGKLPNRKGFDYFYGYSSHTGAHRYYPKKLWKNGEAIKFDDNQGYEGKTYSGDLFLKESLQWITANKDNPFFLHLALQQPHADLQVPDSYRKKFLGKFGKEKPYKKSFYRGEANPKATTVAMITYLDDSVGQVIDLIKKLGIEKKTIVMFTSDNGPHSEGGHHPKHFDSNGPLRGQKRDLYEGGIRVPLIAWCPGKIPGGKTSDLICASWDFPATACEFAGIDPPKNTDGVSWVPTLTGRGVQKKHEYLYWEFYEQGGKQAVRQGKWKGIRLNVRKDRHGKLLLFDLEKDLGETNNIAAEHPDVVERLAKIMDQAHIPSKVVSFSPRKKRRQK